MVTTVPPTIDPRRHDAVLFDLDTAVTTESAAALVRRLQQLGVRTAVFSAGRDCADVLAAAGRGDLFAVRAGGPLEAATAVAARPGRCVVVDGAAAGVAAARHGGFALVIGVDPTGTGEGLRRRGADAVVADLGAVAVRTGDQPMSALESAQSLFGGADDAIATGRPAVFFDFDGTLSDIVDDPGAARLTSGAGAALQLLAARCPVAVLSGRDLADVRDRVGVAGIWYAGSHGFELTGPDGAHHQNDAAVAAVPALADAAAAVRARLSAVCGVVVEHKRFAVAVHYRNAARERVGEVAAAVRDAGQHYGLRVTTGRELLELRPDIDWDKGTTLRWILQHIEHDAGRLVPIYLGDDITDEDAFDAVRDDGIGIVVRHTDDGDRATAARFALDSPTQVSEFSARLARQLSA